MWIKVKGYLNQTTNIALYDITDFKRVSIITGSNTIFKRLNYYVFSTYISIINYLSYESINVFYVSLIDVIRNNIRSPDTDKILV